VRFAGRLAYDGTQYQGFQRQKPGVPTVQAAIEDALQAILNRPITITGAGRTDSGVHASGQVIAFEADWQHRPLDLLRAANANLPADIALQSLGEVDESFHPRFDARSRTYVYQMVIAPVRDPLRERYFWQHRQILALAPMREAAQHLVGEHDFATFGQPTQGESTIRCVTRLEIEAVGDMISLTIEANAFLQRMVRSITGTLVDVGRSKMTVAAFVQAFEKAERSQAGPSAPPQGLTLTQVTYEPGVGPQEVEHISVEPSKINR
jgi:tRNA pseudouridine38-40 synthase